MDSLYEAVCLTQNNRPKQKEEPFGSAFSLH